MANKKILYIVVAVLTLAIVGGGLFFFLGSKGAQEEAETDLQANIPPAAEETPVDKQAMVDCGIGGDPNCFVNRMNECLPVTVRMVGSDKTTNIELVILGIEDETCHFQRKINDAMNLNCFFPKGTMNMNTLAQTFGEEKGLQDVVDAACKGGW